MCKKIIVSSCETNKKPPFSYTFFQKRWQGKFLGLQDYYCSIIFPCDYYGYSATLATIVGGRNCKSLTEKAEEVGKAVRVRNDICLGV